MLLVHGHKVNFPSLTFIFSSLFLGQLIFRMVHNIFRQSLRRAKQDPFITLRVAAGGFKAVLDLGREVQNWRVSRQNLYTEEKLCAGAAEDWLQEGAAATGRKVPDRFLFSLE